MEKVRLGRTGLEASVAGLGGGGASRLGQAKGLSPDQSADLVRAALDLGINVVDTAPSYGTEAIVGAALKGRRDSVILSGKVRANRVGTPLDSADLINGLELIASVEESLRTLATDRLDILYVHGVRPHQYDHTSSVLLPAMRILQLQGKVRFFGMTEGFGVDREHVSLRRAIADGDWDVLMLGLNLLNPSAQRELLPAARANDIGAMCMYAVRGALAQPAIFRAVIARMIAAGEIDRDTAADDLLELLLSPQVAAALPEAAYRFCRHAPGMHVVLFGASSRAHIEENIRSINGPALPPEIIARLARVFENVRSETGDPPA